MPAGLWGMHTQNMCPDPATGLPRHIGAMPCSVNGYIDMQFPWPWLINEAATLSPENSDGSYCTGYYDWTQGPNTQNYIYYLVTGQDLGPGGTPGMCHHTECTFSAKDLCNALYDDCEGACQAVLDPNCDGPGDDEWFFGYNCITADEYGPNDPYTGMGLGYGSGDVNADDDVNVSDVVAIIGWVVCGIDTEGYGGIPEGEAEYEEGCIINCNPDTNPNCPPSGVLTFQEVTTDLLRNADVQGCRDLPGHERYLHCYDENGNYTGPGDGNVNVLDVIQIIDTIIDLTPEQRSEFNTQIRQIQASINRPVPKTRQASRAPGRGPAPRGSEIPPEFRQKLASVTDIIDKSWPPPKPNRRGGRTRPAPRGRGGRKMPHGGSSLDSCPRGEVLAPDGRCYPEVEGLVGSIGIPGHNLDMTFKRGGKPKWPTPKGRGRKMQAGGNLCPTGTVRAADGSCIPG